MISIYNIDIKSEPWILLGLISQLLFFFRFFIQWVVSEINKTSLIPVAFWYFSILGAIGLLSYSIHIKDPVFILGNSFGLLIYSRNLVLIKRKKGGS